MVSPFPLAQLDFRRALMWLAEGDLARARNWLVAAHRRLPEYAPAQGHLAEVEAALGETDSAIARLRPLTLTSDDPDYAAQLARILGEVGRVRRPVRDRAAARTTNSSRITPRPSPTTRRSSGCRRVPTRIGHCRSRR